MKEVYKYFEHDIDGKLISETPLIHLEPIRKICIVVVDNDGFEKIYETYSVEWECENNFYHQTDLAFIKKVPKDAVIDITKEEDEKRLTELIEQRNKIRTAAYESLRSVNFPINQLF